MFAITAPLRPVFAFGKLKNAQFRSALFLLVDSQTKVNIWNKVEGNLNLMTDSHEASGQTDGEGGRATQPRPQRDITFHPDFHGNNARLLHHHGAVQVEEAHHACHLQVRLINLQYTRHVHLSKYHPQGTNIKKLTS
jgi:hypothetical protein